MKVEGVYRTGGGKGHVVHFAECHYLRRRPDAVQALPIMPSALYAGPQRFCQYCSPVSAAYRKERKTVTKFAEKHHQKLTIEHGMLHLTNGYSAWLLVPSDHRGRICLYHKNTQKRPGEESPIEGYHFQRDSWKSIQAIQRYIESHDQYRKAENKKLQAEKKAERKEKKQQKRLVASTVSSYYKSLGRKKRLPHYTPKRKQVVTANTADWEAFKALFKPCAVE